MLRATQGRPAVQGASRLLGVGDRSATSRSADSRQRAADQLRRGVWAGEDQPTGHLVRRRHAELHRRERCTGQSACLRRISVDRLRALHGQASRGRRPAQRALAGGVQDRMRHARAVANRIRFMRPGLRVRVAFCDLNTPRLVDVVTPDAVVTPFLLADAYHARIDIPRQIASCGATARQADVLGEDDRLVSVLHERLADLGVSAHDPQLGVLVVAIGSTHAAANTRTAQVADKLIAGTQWACATTAFATGSGPSLTETATELRRRGARHVVIAPWFLA